MSDFDDLLVDFDVTPVIGLGNSTTHSNAPSTTRGAEDREFTPEQKAKITQNDAWWQKNAHDYQLRSVSTPERPETTLEVIDRYLGKTEPRPPPNKDNPDPDELFNRGKFRVRFDPQTKAELREIQMEEAHEKTEEEVRRFAFEVFHDPFELEKFTLPHSILWNNKWHETRDPEYLGRAGLSMLSHTVLWLSCLLIFFTFWNLLYNFRFFTAFFQVWLGLAVWRASAEEFTRRIDAQCRYYMNGLVLAIETFPEKEVELIRIVELNSQAQKRRRAQLERYFLICMFTCSVLGIISATAYQIIPAFL